MSRTRTLPPVIFLVFVLVALRCSGAQQAAPPSNATGNRIEVDLRAPQDAVRTGGAGRYLIFLCKGSKKLSLFDVSQARVVRQLDVMSGDVRYAAGLDKLIVVLPAQKLMHRYRLPDLQRERTVSLPGGEPVEKIIMGSSSRGPLLLWYGVTGKFWDIDRMRVLNVKGKSFQGSDFLRKPYALRVSSDGRTFIGWLTGLTGQAYDLLRLTRNSTSFSQSPDVHSFNGHWAQPNADGSLVLRYGGGMYSRDFKVIASDEFARSVLLPTEDPRFFLCVRPQDDKRTSQVSICTTADRREVYTIKDLELLTDSPISTEWGLFREEPRVRYLPSAGLLVTLPQSNQHVVLRRVNLADGLQASGQDYLFVISKPDDLAVVGSTYTYQIELLSKSSDITYQLESGPPGMAVSKEGIVNWPVKQRPVGGTEKVIVSIKSGTGTEVFHSFDLSVVRPSEAAAAVKPDAAAPTPPASSGAVKVDEEMLELPEGSSRIVPGLDYRSLLLLQGNRLVRLGPDGVSVQEQRQLQREYKFVGERPAYFVAAGEEPSTIELIDKKNLEVTRSIPLNRGELTDLALHPTKPVCYVAFRAGADLPRYQFVMYEEATGEGRESESYIGRWLQVHPNGRLLVAGFGDIYEAGARLLLNPDQIRLVPEYGDICWLLTYRLDRAGVPELKELKQKAGGNAKGIRMSRDGARVSLLSHVGYPQFSENLAAWHPDDLQKVPVTYAVKGKGTTYELAFHPVLPLVASPGNGSVVFFHRETGALEENRWDLPSDGLEGAEIQRIYFSPDGRNLVLDTSANEVHYLRKVALKLSQSEVDALGRNADRERLASAGAAATKLVKFPLADLDTFAGGEGKPMTAKDVGRSFMDSVVVIRGADGSGTGFVVGSQGYIVTCAHCLPDTGAIQVTYRHRVGGQVETSSRQAQLLYFDERRDLALVKIEAAEPIRPVRLATDGKVESGEHVSIIGNPGLGSTVLDYTMTQGIVSNPRRDLDGRMFIQTSAPVNPGSSGGPMFNSEGLVIGLVVAKAHLEGAGFAVPAEDVVHFLLAGTSREGADGTLLRRWVDSSGKYRIDARYAGTASDSLHLVKVDGSEVTVPIERLSEADRAFARLLNAPAYPNPLSGPGAP